MITFSLNSVEDIGCISTVSFVVTSFVVTLPQKGKQYEKGGSLAFVESMFCGDVR